MCCRARDRIEPERVLSIFSNIFFVLYLFLALLFYRERLFCDVSYYLLSIINNARFLVGNRLSEALTQVPVILARMANLRVETIAQIFSVSFVFYHFLIFFLIRYVYKKTTLAFFTVLLLTLGVQHTFYWPTNQVPESLAFSVLFYAAFSSRDTYEKLKRAGNYALMISAFAVALLYHPITSIALLYVIIFDLNQKRKLSYHHVVFVALCVLYVIYKKYFGSSYETDRMVISLQNKNLDYLYKVLLLLLTKYYFHLLFLFLVGLCYLLKKQYLELLFIYVSFWGYVGLLNIFQDTSINFFYPEHFYLLLTLIVFLPLLADIFPTVTQPAKLAFVALLLFSTVYSLRTIISTSRIYAFRWQKMRDMVYQTPFYQQSKFVVSMNNYFEKDVTNKEINEHWSYPSESLIQTTIDGKPKILVFDSDLNESIKDPKQRSRRIAFAPWDSIDHTQLNRRYFPLEEGDYVPLNTPMDFNLITNEFIEKLSLEVLNTPKSLKRNTIYYIYVVLNNQNPIPLRSALNKGHEIHVSYHWLKKNEIHIGDGIRTPLEVDLYRTLRQKIKLQTPETEGSYTLAVDIVAENFRWFGINKTVSISITR